MANDQEGFNAGGVVLQIAKAFRDGGLDDGSAAAATLGFIGEMMAFGAHMVSIDWAKNETNEERRVELLRELAESMIQAPPHPGLALQLEVKRASEAADAIGDAIADSEKKT